MNGLASWTLRLSLVAVLGGEAAALLVAGRAPGPVMALAAVELAAALALLVPRLVRVAALALAGVIALAAAIHLAHHDWPPVAFVVFAAGLLVLVLEASDARAPALLRDFERGAIDPSRFPHREHLRVAWTYLQHATLEDAIARYTAALRRLTVKVGVPQKFHATLTVAYLVALHERLERADARALTFDAFVERHPELLGREVIAEHYDARELDAPEAKRHLVLPRRSR